MSKGTKSKGGRPAKITAAVVDRVCETMSYGVPEEYACALHGVNAATFGPAVSRNEAFKLIKRNWDAQFIARACKAIAEGGEVVKVTKTEGNPLTPALSPDGGEGVKTTTTEQRRPWQGMAWLLERRYKPHFNRTDTHALTKSDGCALTVEDMAELERMAQVLHTGGRERERERESGKGGKGERET